MCLCYACYRHRWENLKLRAEKFAGQIKHLEFVSAASAEESQAMLGGGSIPTQHIPSWSVGIETSGQSVDELAQKLRESSPAVIGRVHKDRLLIDMRTVSPGEDLALVEIFQRIEN